MSSYLFADPIVTFKRVGRSCELSYISKRKDGREKNVVFVLAIIDKSFIVSWDVDSKDLVQRFSTNTSYH